MEYIPIYSTVQRIESCPHHIANSQSVIPNFFFWNRILFYFEYLKLQLNWIHFEKSFMKNRLFRKICKMFSFGLLLNQKFIVWTSNERFPVRYFLISSNSSNQSTRKKSPYEQVFIKNYVVYRPFRAKNMHTFVPLVVMLCLRRVLGLLRFKYNQQAEIL